MSTAINTQRVVILGSTGSVGTSTLSVIETLPEHFSVLGLAARNNAEIFQQQIDQFQPRYAYLQSGGAVTGAECLTGDNPLTHLATLPEADIVVIATTGHTAIEPTIAALRAGKIVALANKETIVAAGELVMREAREGPGTLRTVDSEHSAIWQCLGTDRFDPERVRKLILTASGGPFRGRTREQLEHVTPADALKHPTWNMGAKITIDSATLLNKGLEVIEAHWLFDCPLDNIDVIVHPQSIVHSFVEFHDGALLAQLASHDMRIPIQYALTYPRRLAGAGTPLDLATLSKLTFEKPDVDAFPLLQVARDAAGHGSTYPTVLSAADTVAVEAFLQGKLTFQGIAQVIQETLDRHQPARGPLSLTSVHDADEWAHREAQNIIQQRGAAWR